MFRPARALLHPLFLVAAIALAANDWILKGAFGPSVVTGKLSDFAGLLAAQVVVATLLRVRSRDGLTASSAALGLGFAAIKISPFASHLYERALAFVHASNLVDPTDLVALVVLPIGHRVFAAAMDRPATHARRVGEIVALIAALPFCIATSAPTPICDEGSVGRNGEKCIEAFHAATFVYNAGTTQDVVTVRTLRSPLPPSNDPQRLGCSLRDEDFGPPRTIALAPGQALPLDTVPTADRTHVALVDLGEGFPLAVFSARDPADQKVPGSGWGGQNNGSGNPSLGGENDAPVYGLRLSGGLGIDRYARAGDVIRSIGATVTSFQCDRPGVDAGTLPEGGFDGGVTDAAMDAGLDADDAGDGS